MGGGLANAIAAFINPCFHSVIFYRFSQLLYRCHLSVFAKVIWYLNRLLFGVDIDYRADLAGGFCLIHGLGCVIGKDVQSNGRLTVYQGVTIGGSGKSRFYNEKEIWQPILGDDVVVYCNSMILGPVAIGDGVRIKAGEMVTSDICFKS